MKYLTWLVLNDGTCERVTEADIDPGAEAGVIDRALIPLSIGAPGSAGGRGSGYTVTGEIGAKRALLRLLDNGAPVADVGVCLHSRAARGLWYALAEAAGDWMAAIPMPSAPWCAVLCYAPEDALPPWFDDWAKTAGMALLRREGW